MGVCEGPFDNGLATAGRAVRPTIWLLCCVCNWMDWERLPGDWEFSDISPLWEVTKKCRLMDQNYSEESETTSILYYQLQEKERGSGEKGTRQLKLGAGKQRCRTEDPSGLLELIICPELILGLLTSNWHLLPLLITP